MFEPPFKLAARFADPLSLRLVREVLLLTPLRPMPRSGADITAPELQLACELLPLPELGRPARTPPRTPCVGRSVIDFLAGRRCGTVFTAVRGAQDC